MAWNTGVSRVRSSIIPLLFLYCWLCLRRLPPFSLPTGSDESAELLHAPSDRAHRRLFTRLRPGSEKVQPPEAGGRLNSPGAPARWPSRCPTLSVRGWGNDVSLERRISRPRARRRQAKLAPHDVRPLRDGCGLEKRDVPVAALPAKPAIARHDQLLRGDVLQAQPEGVCYIHRPFRLQRPVAYGADANLLLQLALERRKQLDLPHVPVLGLNGPHVAATLLQVKLEGLAVAVVVDHPLHVRVAPAGVNPDFDVIQSLHLAVVGLEHEPHVVMVAAEGVGPEVQGWLLDLDALAAGVAQRQQLFVHRHCHVPDHLPIVLILLSVNIKEQPHHLRGTGAEADGPGGLALRHPPDLGVVQRPVLDLARDPRPAPAGVNLI